MDKQPCVYLLASKRNGTLYVGVTSDLIKRTWQHKQHLVDGFSWKYKVDILVSFQLYVGWKLRYGGKSRSKNGVVCGRFE